MIKYINPTYWDNFNPHNFAPYIFDGAMLRNEYDPIFTSEVISVMERQCEVRQLHKLAALDWRKIKTVDESNLCYALQDIARCYAIWSWLLWRGEYQNKPKFNKGAKLLKGYWVKNLQTAFQDFHSVARNIIALKQELQRDAPTRAHFVQLFSTYLYLFEFNPAYRGRIKSDYNLATTYKQAEFTEQINRAIDILMEWQEFDKENTTNQQRPPTPSSASDDGAKGQAPVFY